jgi:hypothetical protein
MTMFGDMLERDRKRLRLRLARAAWLLSVSLAELRELEAGTRWPDFDTNDRICKLFGWPRAFVGDRGDFGSLRRKAAAFSLARSTQNRPGTCMMMPALS